MRPVQLPRGPEVPKFPLAAMGDMRSSLAPEFLEMRRQNLDEFMQAVFSYPPTQPTVMQFLQASMERSAVTHNRAGNLYPSIVDGLKRLYNAINHAIDGFETDGWRLLLAGICTAGKHHTWW